MSGGKHILGMPKGRRVYGTVKVSEKGQIVIPKDAREQFGIRAGDTLLVLGDDRHGIVITHPDVIRDVARQILENMDREEE